MTHNRKAQQAVSPQTAPTVAQLSPKAEEIVRTSATAFGVLLRAAALYAMLAAYNAADPKFNTGEALTISALLVAACLSPRNKAALGVLLAGGALLAAQIQSKHLDALHQTFYYSVLGFSLLSAAFAAEWLWGRDFQSIRPHNRVRLIRGCGIFAAISAMAIVVSDVVDPPSQLKSPVKNTFGYDFGHPAFVGDYEMLAFLVSGVALAVFVGAVAWPRLRRATLGPATDSSCRYTELIASCALFALIGDTMASLTGLRLYVGSITLGAAVIGVVMWAIVSVIADDTYAERKRVGWIALRIVGWSSYVCGSVIYLTSGGPVAELAYVSVTAAIGWWVLRWMIRDVRKTGFWP